MDDNDFASTSDNAEGFTPEEQAAFDAYERGEEAPSSTAAAPAAEGAPAGGDVAPAAAAPEAAPGEVVDTETDAGSPDENKGKFVRHGAFHQERERRKAVEKELSDLRERFARGDERLRILSEAMQRPAGAAQPAAEPVKVPDPAEDIFGYIEHLKGEIETLRSGQTQLTESQKQAEEIRRANDERNEVVSFYQQDLRAAFQADATVSDAYQHLFAGRVAELQLVGMSQEEATATVREEEFNLAQTARQRGQSPAALIAALAKTRGFAPKAAPAAAAPAETPAQKAERVAAGQAGPGKSLSAAGGAPAGEVTFEMLAAMSERDFEAFATKNPEKLARLMGAEG